MAAAADASSIPIPAFGCGAESDYWMLARKWEVGSFRAAGEDHRARAPIRWLAGSAAIGVGAGPRDSARDRTSGRHWRDERKDSHERVFLFMIPLVHRRAPSSRMHRARILQWEVEDGPVTNGRRQYCSTTRTLTLSGFCPLERDLDSGVGRFEGNAKAAPAGGEVRAPFVRLRLTLAPSELSDALIPLLCASPNHSANHRAMICDVVDGLPQGAISSFLSHARPPKPSKLGYGDRRA